MTLSTKDRPAPTIPGKPDTATCRRCGQPFDYIRTTSPRVQCAPCTVEHHRERKARNGKAIRQRGPRPNYRKLIPYAGFDPEECFSQRYRFYTQTNPEI